jgi:hypothetical protein
MNIISDKIFIKFRAEKYDFKLYKRFFMEKMTRICQIWMIPPRAVEVCMPKFYPANTGNQGNQRTRKCCRKET